MMNITDLPPEIISQIASHLDSLSAIASLALTCKHLNAELSQVDCQAYRAFLERCFPEANFVKPYKDTARALASRSRAWDRRAFIARVLDPKIPYRPPPIRHKIGYQPVIDSYECWFGGRWSDRREILAWGAGPRLIMRKRRASRFDETEDGTPVIPSTEWSYYDSPGRGFAQEDILDVKILRPEQRVVAQGEDVVLRRANDEIAMLNYDYSEKAFKLKHQYVTNEGIECLDINNASEPLMAVAYKETNTSLFPVYPDFQTKGPLAQIAKDDQPAASIRNRCLKFISDDRIAIAKQAPDSGRYSPINIYQIRPDGSDKLIFHSETAIFPDITTNITTHTHRRGNANTITPISSTTILGGSPGSLFLSGWTDGIVRLHDLRCPSASLSAATTTYTDNVDDGQILSLLPLSHTRFLAGSSQSGCLKTFDLRLSSRSQHQQRYNYLSATKFLPGRRATDRTDAETARLDPLTRRQINTLLAIDLSISDRQFYRPNIANTTYPASSSSSSAGGPHMYVNRYPGPQMPTFNNHYHPAFTAAQSTFARARNTARYRGAVYSLSTPSSLSRTVYAGIENHVIQLDAAATDDVLSESKLDFDWAVFDALAPPRFDPETYSGGEDYSYGYPDADAGMAMEMGVEMGTGMGTNDEVVDLACYERPSVAAEEAGMGVETMDEERGGGGSIGVVVRENMPLWKQVGLGKMRRGQVDSVAGWDGRWMVEGQGEWRRGGIA